MGQLLESNSVLAIGLASNIASTLNSLGTNTTSNDSSSMDASKQVSMTLKKCQINNMEMCPYYEFSGFNGMDFLRIQGFARHFP